VSARVFLTPIAARQIQAARNLWTPLEHAFEQAFGDTSGMVLRQLKHGYELVRVIEALGDGRTVLERMDGMRITHMLGSTPTEPRAA
jgi:hypothetical protein